MKMKLFLVFVNYLKGANTPEEPVKKDGWRSKFQMLTILQLNVCLEDFLNMSKYWKSIQMDNYKRVVQIFVAISLVKWFLCCNENE